MDRGIVNNSTPLAQFAKLVSEIGELGDNIAKERDVTDDIGDCLVVLNTLAIMNDTTLEECLKVAYNDITNHLTILGCSITTHNRIRCIGSQRTYLCTMM
jgi:hypothetical protein